jgi:membrane protease YdiL (CAAX protease family)
MKQSEDSLVEQQSSKAPWTIQQTFLAIILTLAPWIILAVSLSPGNSAPGTRALSPRLDLINAIVIFFLSSFIEGAFLIAPLYFANRALHSITPHVRLAWQSLGLKKFNVGQALSWIVVFLPLIFAVDTLYQYLITVLHLNLQTNDQVILARSKLEPISTYATLLVAVFVAPFCEEIFFRGFVFAGLLHRMPVGWAIVLSALLFAIAHLDPGSFAVLFIIGLALAVLRWRTGSLWPGIVLHAINNGIGALAIILVMQGVMKS